jgi:cold shock CspA family protein
LDVGRWQLSRSDQEAQKQFLAWFVVTRSANQRGIAFSTEQGALENATKERGIVIWHHEVQWGFAITLEGRNVFVHKSGFRDHRQVAKVHAGMKIEFDLPAACRQCDCKK